MWESKAAPGRLDELVAHVLATTDVVAQVFRSPDGRVVVIDPTDRGPAEPPDALLERPPHAWRFEPVDRPTAG